MPCSSRSTRRTGREVWTTKVDDNRNGYYMSLAPLVADGKVIVGASGGELGIRGFVAAFDLETGKELWRTSPCRRRASPAARRGRRATSGRRAAVRSGSPATTIPTRTWRTGAPATAARGWATSVPGDNLYTSSTIAIDRRDRHDQGPPPVPPERFVGLGRSLAAHPGRLHAQRPHGQRPDRRGARRLSVVPRARPTARSTSSRASRS